MTNDNQNAIFQLAFDLANTTSCNLYLTGKAGTGKTTFLRYLKENCKKKLVVVAPTGVAAINAGGVTIHSFFQLPFGAYIPDAQTGFGLHDGIVNKHALAKNLKIAGNKKKIIEELELLIIDEVSMLRSDMLDAMDTVLRMLRKNMKPFGGVQVVFIGDLYQLPPVVKDQEKELLDQYYHSAFFFDAKVLEQNPPVYLELKKIYRQSEEVFINLLNKIRHANLNHDDLELLHKQYQPNFTGTGDNYITLTTHNHKADVINARELNTLHTPLYTFRGELKGDFSDKQLPTEMQLKLKKGAQVMFVKNDSSVDKKYYNGKIGVISNIDEEEIMVRFPDSIKEMKVERETWEQISYQLNKETQGIDEKIIGQYIQYPIRLAWAITIHKSQGLTFEKAIIDAGDAFAPGQVYVALSRCTSLNGVVLLSRISTNSIRNEKRIAEYGLQEKEEHVLLNKLAEEQFKFQIDKLLALFDWSKIINALIGLQEATAISKTLNDKADIFIMLQKLISSTQEQEAYANKFKKQLENLIAETIPSELNRILKDRAGKGINYFVQSLESEIYEPLVKLIQGLSGKSKIKKYLEDVYYSKEVCEQKLHALQSFTYFGESLCEPREKKMMEVKIPKKAKGDSAKESLAYFTAGKSIEEIAVIRNLAVSTIQGHLADFVKTGELEITSLMKLEDVAVIKTAYLSSEEKTGNAIKAATQDKYTYAEIKCALNYLIYMKEI